MLVDSHCHLAGDTFVSDLPDVVARARAAGLASAVCILSASDPEELSRGQVVAAAWPEIRFAAAVHPHQAGQYGRDATGAVAATRAAAAACGAVALGEMGLDYHYDFSPRDVQQLVFAAQVDLARDLGLPVVIHTRDAADDTFAVLSEAGGRAVRGVLHCFTGSIDEARRGLDLGLHISLSGIVTFPRADTLRDVARMVPDDRLLLESDAPYLAPVPYRGRRNEPAWIAETLRVVASARRVTEDALAAHVAANFSALFSGLVEGGRPSRQGPAR